MSVLSASMKDRQLLAPGALRPSTLLTQTPTLTSRHACLQTAKVLPCGHLFHVGCLRDWLQTAGQANFTCPICRSSLFSAPRTGRPPASSGVGVGNIGAAAAGSRGCLEPTTERAQPQAQPLHHSQAIFEAPQSEVPDVSRRLRLLDPPARRRGNSASPAARRADAGSADECTALAASPLAAAPAAAEPSLATTPAAARAAAAAAVALAASERDSPPPTRWSGEFTGAQLSATAQQLSAAAAVRAEQTLRAFAARLAAGRMSAVHQVRTEHIPARIPHSRSLLDVGMTPIGHTGRVTCADSARSWQSTASLADR